MIDLHSPWVDLIVIALCTIGLVAAAILTVRRYEFFGTHTMFHRRLMLVDLMVALALVEMLFDALAESVLIVDPLRAALHLLALVGRGGVVTGVVALLVTFPGDDG